MTILEMPNEMPRYKITRAMYDRMVEAGILEDQHVELIDGEIVQMSPIDHPHVSACTLASDVLRALFGRGYHVRVQAPLAIGDSEPQPDVTVIRGSIRDYTYHPSTAELVVEVSDSTIRSDRKIKSSLYASAGIREYWLLNLRKNQLEVFRAPVADEAEKFGYRYKDMCVIPKDGSVVPLAAPKATIPVADMLP